MAFILDKILGSQTNAAELRVNVPVGAITGASSLWYEGAPVCIEGGVVKAVSNDKRATFFVERQTMCKSANDILPLVKMLPNMVFRVPFYGDPSAVKVGERVQVFIGAYAQKASAEPAYGPIIVDKLNAKESKDEILVMFDK